MMQVTLIGEGEGFEAAKALLEHHGIMVVSHEQAARTKAFEEEMRAIADAFFATNVFDPPSGEDYPLFRFLAARYPCRFLWTIMPRKHAQRWRRWQGATPRESRNRWKQVEP